MLQKPKIIKIKAPDFGKTISRIYLDKVKNDKKTVLPFTNPRKAGIWASNNINIFNILNTIC